MRKVLTSILTIAFCLVALAGAVYAYFTSKVVVEGNVLGSGNAILKVTNDLNTWVELPAMEVSSAYPGWNQSYPMYFKNDSNVPITLKVRPAVGSPSGEGKLLDEIYMSFSDPDGNSIGEPRPLRAWLTAGDNPILASLAQGKRTGKWKLDLSMPSGATTQGKSLAFNLLFDGIQE